MAEAAALASAGEFDQGTGSFERPVQCLSFASRPEDYAPACVKDDFSIAETPSIDVLKSLISALRRRRFVEIKRSDA